MLFWSRTLSVNLPLADLLSLKKIYRTVYQYFSSSDVGFILIWLNQFLSTAVTNELKQISKQVSVTIAYSFLLFCVLWSTTVLFVAWETRISREREERKAIFMYWWLSFTFESYKPQPCTTCSVTCCQQGEEVQHEFTQLRRWQCTSGFKINNLHKECPEVITYNMKSLDLILIAFDLCTIKHIWVLCSERVEFSLFMHTHEDIHHEVYTSNKHQSPWGVLYIYKSELLR